MTRPPICLLANPTALSITAPVILAIGGEVNKLKVPPVSAKSAADNSVDVAPCPIPDPGLSVFNALSIEFKERFSAKFLALPKRDPCGRLFTVDITLAALAKEYCPISANPD